MTAPDLPEDPRQWPDDPFELLGCTPNTDRKELKRAYTRRIRKYKPENHPDEFRRLRDAYEWAERVVKHREEFQKWQQDSPGDDDDAPAGNESPGDSEPARPLEDAPAPEPPGEPGETPREERSPRISRASREQLIETFWNEACAGDVATAYRRLVELHQERPGDEELCVRLYWLRRLAPEVDSVREAVSWLAEGLARSGLRGRLLELYTAHLDEDPDEALSDRCSRLLDLPGPLGSVYTLVIWRWRAAARLNRYLLVSQDLARLRARFVDEDREMWLRLVLAAMGYMAWEPEDHPRDALKECQREIDEASDLHLKMADELDRSDLLLALAEARHSLALGMPPWPSRRAGSWPELRGDQLARTLAAMLPVLWNAPPSAVRGWLWEWVAMLVRDPQVGLGQLDVLYRATPAFLGFVGELLGQLGGPAEEPEEILHDALTRRVLSFFDFVETRQYSELRPRLAALCVGECLPLNRILEVLEEQDSYYQFAEPLRNDSAIRTLIIAHRTFWA